MSSWVECWVSDIVKKCKLGIDPEKVWNVRIAVDQITWKKKLILEYHSSGEMTNED